MKVVKEQNSKLQKIQLIKFIIMTKLQVKAFVFQLLCFAVLFILFRILLEKYSNLDEYYKDFIVIYVYDNFGFVTLDISNKATGLFILSYST